MLIFPDEKETQLAPPTESLYYPMILVTQSCFNTPEVIGVWLTNKTSYTTCIEMILNNWQGNRRQNG